MQYDTYFTACSSGAPRHNTSFNPRLHSYLLPESLLLFQCHEGYVITNLNPDALRRPV